jgi:hypothetical protein
MGIMGVCDGIDGDVGLCEPKRVDGDCLGFVVSR